MKCPCSPDCKIRSTYCHASCNAYKLYETAKRKEYEDRKKEREMIQGYNDYYFRQNYKMKKICRSKIKNYAK